MSVNQVTLIGNLGHDPEIRYTGGGGAIATLSLATSERWKGKDGEWEEKTEWHRVVFFGKQAEICEKFLHKGSKIYVRGKIQTRKWQDSDGNDKYTTEVYGYEMKMLDSKPQGESQAKPEPKQQSFRAKEEPPEPFADDPLPF